MSSFLEVIQQLKTNQEAINANLAKIESLGGSVNKSLLRELIQDARELHEGSVILSYILFDEQNKKSEQLEIQLQEKEPLPQVSNSVESEHEVEDGVNEALEFTQEEKTKTEKDTQTIDDIPSQEEIVEQLENEIASAISSNSSGLLYDSQEEEDNSLAAKLARKKIENLIKEMDESNDLSLLEDLEDLKKKIEFYQSTL